MSNTDYNKEKNQLLQSLLSRSKKKGYIHAATIIERFRKYGISENEKENIFEVFHNEGIEVIFEDEEDDPDIPPALSSTSLEDELKHDGRDAYYADPLQIYIKEIHRYPTLSHKETLELVRQKLAGDSKAREYLINCNLKYAFSVASRYIRTGIPLLDLIQQANIGLMKAADMYNPNRGTRFTTYAVFWMRHSILGILMSNPISFDYLIISALILLKSKQHPKTSIWNSCAIQPTLRLQIRSVYRLHR